MSEKVFVTGIGVISSIGHSVGANFERLSRGEDGLTHATILPTKHDHLFLGEVKLRNEELSEAVGYHREPVSRSSLLALHAAQEAMAGKKGSIPGRLGIYSANTGGGMSLTEKHYLKYFEDDTNPSIYDTVENHHCADSTEVLIREFSSVTTAGTVSTACSSSANSIMFGARMIRAGKLDAALCGGVEALSLFTLNGFRSLKIMDEEKCRPFDKSRAGLNLGEGAAYLLLESESSVKESGSKVICELRGWANANDAYHQTATSPRGDGATMAMRNSISMAELLPFQVQYVNAHGTGTENNDETEAKAIERVFGPEYPLVSSTKGFIGHTLGAAGAIESVYSILSITQGLVPPNLRFKERLGNLMWGPVTEPRKEEVRLALSCSFGFGGNATSLLFSE
jgi:3-oxoacyl-[acyl-carrier-protein] synthase-1